MKPCPRVCSTPVILLFHHQASYLCHLHLLSMTLPKNLIREEVVSTEERIKDLYDEFTAKHTDENIMEKEHDISGYENVLKATDNDGSDASPVETTVYSTKVTAAKN